MYRREQKYVISYDISSNKTRNKVATELENYGRRVQYSVFECKLTDMRFQKLYERLLELCGTSETDSIRIYMLCENCTRKTSIIGIQKETIEDEIVIII